MKTCRVCNIEKHDSEFHMRAADRGVLHTRCKLCTKEYDKVVYAKNACKISGNKKKYYANNQERILAQRKQHYADNTDAVKQRNYAYKKENHAYYIGKVKERQLSKLKRTPVWADKERIQSYYNVCAFFNDVNGYAKYHVDHIIPLQGKTVSGLHVHNNLQVIPAKENLSKGNRHELS